MDNIDPIERRMRELFFAKCNKHINHAQEKHPVFAYKINSRFNAVKYKVLADDHRQFRDEEHERKESSIEVILLGEVYEFMEAFSRGDLEAAKEEAADVVAVLFRAIKWASVAGIFVGAAALNNPLLTNTKQ